MYSLQVLRLDSGKAACYDGSLMGKHWFDDYVDDVPQVFELGGDEADAAFWDEFFLLECQTEGDDRRFTITIKDEVTGEKRVLKHVRLSAGAHKRRE